MSDPSLTARYNNPKKRPLAKRTRNLLIGGALAIGVGAAAYFGVANYTTTSAQDISFRMISPTEAEAVVQVEYNTKHRVQCDIRALNASKAVVGFTTIVFDAEDEPRNVSQRRAVPLLTDNLAVTAGIDGCREFPRDFKG